MADVFIRVEANTASAVQNLLKVAAAEGQVEAAGKKARVSVGELEKAFTKIGQNMGNLQSGLAQLVQGFNVHPVLMLADAVKSLYDDWMRAKQAAKDYQKTIFDIAATEDLRKLPEIKKLFDTTKAPGVTDATKAAIFQGLQKDLSGADLETMFKAVVKQAPALPAGRAGEFADFAGFMKNASGLGAGDTMDASVHVFQSLKGQMGKFDKKAFEQLMQMGMGQSESLGTVLSFAKTEQGGAALRKMIDLSMAPPELKALQRGQQRSGEDLARERFRGMDQNERLRALMFDPDLQQSLMGGALAEARVGLEGRSSSIMGVKRAIAGNRAQDQLDLGLAGTPEMARVLAEQRVDEQLSKENVIARNSGVLRERMIGEEMTQMESMRQTRVDLQLSDATVDRLIEALERNTQATQGNTQGGGTNAHTE